jgi:hypothetical protein
MQKCFLLLLSCISLSAYAQQLYQMPTGVESRLSSQGVNFQPVTVDARGKFMRLFELEKAPALSDPSLPNGWVNFTGWMIILPLVIFTLISPSIICRSWRRCRKELKNYSNIHKNKVHGKIFNYNYRNAKFWDDNKGAEPERLPEKLFNKW